MTSNSMTLYDFATAGLLCSLILYVAFGQITVRKLRKNPETKERLGVEFASGLDIFNAAQALSLPKKLREMLERGYLSALYANSAMLYQHTTKLDRGLARSMYWLFMLSVLLLIGAVCGGYTE
jgi:hypothetical protein